MRLHTKTVFVIWLLFFQFNNAISQAPPNDNCDNAIELEIDANFVCANSIQATTVGASPSSQPFFVCSGTSFADDVWFSFTTESILPEGALVIQCYFDEPFVDVPSVGMAVYTGCNWTSKPIDCFSTADPLRNKLVLFSGAMTPDETYYVRVWSTPGMNENSGTFEICAFYEPPSNDVVLWGNNPGEGDFEGGLNDWTTTAISPDTSAFWRWAGCACSGGELDQSILSSPTSYNGAAIFDADSLNCCLDDDPPPPIIQQTGELWSPIIDCSNFPAVAVKFYQSYAALTSKTSLAYSIDGGTTWLDTIEVNEEFVPNQKTYSPSFHRIPILEASGEPEFRLKFIFSGNFYNWIIDDVQLVSLENNNLSLEENSFAIPPNAMWPISQLECFGFQGNISNLGAVAQPNVNFDVSILEETNSTEVYNATENLGTLAPLTFLENQEIAGCYTPENNTNSYIGTYTLSSDSMDIHPENNNGSFDFETTDFVFAKERGGTQSIHPEFLSWNIGDPHSWAFGNFFHIVKGSEDDPKVYALSGTFSIGNADALNVAGQVVSLFLYKWEEDTNDDGNMDPDERTKIAYAHYVIQGTESPLDLITRQLISYPDGNPSDPQSITLDSNQDYVLMLEYSTESTTNIEFVVSSEYDYNSQITLSKLNGTPRYASMLGIAGSLDTIAYKSDGIFGRDIVPVVRLNLTDQLVNTESVPTKEYALKLSPNPVNNILHLNIHSEEAMQEVTIRVFDLNGRMVFTKDYIISGDEIIPFDVSNFMTGAYFLQFVSENYVKTERFIVQH